MKNKTPFLGVLLPWLVFSPVEGFQSIGLQSIRPRSAGVTQHVSLGRHVLWEKFEKNDGVVDSGLNWDYDLWKEVNLRTRRRSDDDPEDDNNNQQQLPGAPPAWRTPGETSLALQQRFKLWLLTVRAKRAKITPSVVQEWMKDWTFQKTLIVMNILFYFYQVNTSILKRANLFGKINQPMKSALAMDFMYVGKLAIQQPHRFITSGFLHGSFLHLFCNIQSWWGGIPGWVETASGAGRYLTVFLFSVVGGNLSHSMFTQNGSLIPTVGASGGICGLLGYTWMLLRQMKTMQSQRYSRHLAKYMVQLVIYGSLMSRVSNAAHVGGFVTGAALGYLVGPRFGKSYVAKRWGNDDYLKIAPSPRMTPELRQLMGPSMVMESKSRIPLYALWAGTLVFVFLDPNPAYQNIPRAIYTGLSRPGSLSGRLFFR